MLEVIYKTNTVLKIWALSLSSVILETACFSLWFSWEKFNVFSRTDRRDSGSFVGRTSVCATTDWGGVVGRLSEYVVGKYICPWTIIYNQLP